MKEELLDILKDKNSALLQIGSVFVWQNTKYRVRHIEERPIEGSEETRLLIKVKALDT